MTTDRTEPPFVGDERVLLDGFLDYYRATLAVKCDGLSDDQLRQRAVPPSKLSLLGLVRHMAEVERAWFRDRAAGEVDDPIWVTDDRPDADFDDVDTADVGEAFDTWRDHCQRSREIVAGFDSLDHVFRINDRWEVDLRWMLIHMVEEYARHAGHADFLRERVDGATGD